MNTMSAQDEFAFIKSTNPKTVREAIDKIEAANAFLSLRHKHLLVDEPEETKDSSDLKEIEFFTREFNILFRYTMIARKQAIKQAMNTYLSNIAFNSCMV